MVSMMLELLKARFSEHKGLHPDLEWLEVEQRLRVFPDAIAVLQKMEESGGEFSATAQRSPHPGAEACAMTKRLCRDAPKTRRQAAQNGKRKRSAFR